jgi:hypothetical protein
MEAASLIESEVHIIFLPLNGSTSTVLGLLKIRIKTFNHGQLNA